MILKSHADGYYQSFPSQLKCLNIGSSNRKKNNETIFTLRQVFVLHDFIILPQSVYQQC